MIKIDGKQLPAPTDYVVGIHDISKAERNARGEMIIERIATKRKIELFWKHLDKAELSRVLNLVSPVFFKVEYQDPQDDSKKIGTFYCGDRNVQGIDYVNGQMYWKEIKFNLIER